MCESGAIKFMAIAFVVYACELVGSYSFATALHRGGRMIFIYFMQIHSNVKEGQIEG